MTKKLIIQNYDSLLKEVKSHIDQTRSSIDHVVVRLKVEMAWSIGKSISKHLEQNQQSQKNSYGTHLFKSLSNDTSIELRTLYRMYAFYKTYKVLPKDNEKLNWSHYQLLSGIKKKDERRYLEDLVQDQGLSVSDLRKTITKSSDQKKIANPTLAPRRGELNRYKLFRPVGAQQDYIDCGFKIYRELTKKLPKGVKIVEGAKSTEIYTYVGYLNRIVDGDTLRVTLDVGFGIMHEEILRLRGINAAEASAPGGTEATDGLKKILANQESFIVKTSSTDTYNRYLADIFLNDGTYLNQLLLDKKLATLF